MDKIIVTLYDTIYDIEYRFRMVKGIVEWADDEWIWHEESEPITRDRAKALIYAKYYDILVQDICDKGKHTL